MSKQRSMSKKLRFEIFKRDGFTCQYCGRQPPEVVLEVDHIQPVSKGGVNDPLNLTTSCQDCNRGKGDRELGRVAPRPDADLEWLAAQQEIAELRRYQQGRAARDKLTKQIITLLQETWTFYWQTDQIPDDRVFAMWLQYTDPDVIEQAIMWAGYNSDDIRGLDRRIRYTAGTMHRMRREQEGE